MWARNAQGLKNLFRLSSRASMEGHYVKWPRMDMELIAEHAEGIMATTGCPSGAVQTRLRLGQFDEALKTAAAYQDIFGKDNYFLEIMDHGLSIEHRVRDGLLEISRKLGIPPLVTNDSHYTHESQAEAHDVLLCVQTGSNIADRTGSGSTAAATSSSRPTRCARWTRRTPGWRAAATPCWWRRRSTPPACSPSGT